MAAALRDSRNSIIESACRCIGAGNAIACSGCIRPLQRHTDILPNLSTSRRRQAAPSLLATVTLHLCLRQARRLTLPAQMLKSVMSALLPDSSVTVTTGFLTDWPDQGAFSSPLQTQQAQRSMPGIGPPLLSYPHALPNSATG